MMTEKEAKGRYCAIRDINCLASGCMQWRWKYDQQSALQFEADKMVKEGFRIYGWRNGTLGPQALMARQTEYGYCGLAGEPLLPEARENVVAMRRAD